MSKYTESVKLLERLHMQFPLKVTVEDPVVEGKLLTFSKENVYEITRIVEGAIGMEREICASLYAQMGRLHRAFEKATAMSEMKARRFKAKIVNELFEKSEESGGKKPTEKQQEAAYRSHEDYIAVEKEVLHNQTIANLFLDLKRAIDIKGSILKDLVYSQGVHERQQADREAREQRIDELEKEYKDIEDDIEAAMQEAMNKPAADKKKKRQNRKVV